MVTADGDILLSVTPPFKINNALKILRDRESKLKVILPKDSGVPCITHSVVNVTLSGPHAHRPSH